MENSGIFFITCECYGAKFVKVGRSTDVASRRRELQCGCPFVLTIEYVQSVDEKDALEQERRCRSQFRTIQQKIQRDETWKSSTDENLMPRWFLFTGEIETFVRELKNSESPESSLAIDQQALLF